MLPAIVSKFRLNARDLTEISSILPSALNVLANALIYFEFNI